MREPLAAEARRGRAVFRELDRYLGIIVDAIRELDGEAEVYPLGPVAGGHVYSSDIDVLVVTGERPERVIAHLWSRGVEDPFETHVVTREMLPAYRGRSRLARIA